MTDPLPPTTSAQLSDDQEPPRDPSRIARWVTEWFSPRILVAGLPIAVALAEPPRVPRLLWALVNVIACSGVPVVAIERARRSGAVKSGHHITDRRERLGPLTVALVSVAVGLAALHLGHAPDDLSALAWAMLAGLMSAMAITAAWKISFHAAVATAAVVVLADVYGDWLWWSGIAAVAIGWSRIRLREHTPAQVLAGALLGAAVSGGLFLLLT